MSAEDTSAAAVGGSALSEGLGAWHPIETAPKDGTYVIVWPPTWTGVTSCARWHTDEYAKKPRPYWSRTDDLGRVSVSRENPPTHWTLLAPPASA
jgi:hypothetical protein